MSEHSNYCYWYALWLSYSIVVYIKSVWIHDHNWHLMPERGGWWLAWVQRKHDVRGLFQMVVTTS
jgi:hypothetical protein